MVFDLFAGEMHCLCRQNISSAFKYLYLALSATAFSATSRRQKYIVFGKSGEKGLAGSGKQVFIVIDFDVYFAGMHKKFLCDKQHDDKQQCYCQKYCDT